MSAEGDDRAAVVLLWHMHQPEYRIDGSPLLPWTYLHALRGYTDMAEHLDAVPEARAVINFSPVLLDQLLNLAQDAQALAGQAAIPPAEPLLAALLELPTGVARTAVLRACLRTHPRNAQDRYTDYARLAQTARNALEQGESAIAALSDTVVGDLVVWYHLIWLAESVRSGDPRARALIAHRHNFDAGHRSTLLALIGELLTKLVSRYRQMAAEGRIELSMSPYYHPILPLLLDFGSAREAAPDTALPDEPYPGGRQQARWHLESARDRFEQVFGIRPRGCWPSEAAVSQASIDLMHELGFDWFATSQSVQNATLHQHGEQLDPHSCTYRLRGNHMLCFFRDDGLSDRIGFVYKDWQPRDAVADLVHRVEQLATHREGRTVVLALDGENPWEYYPENGIEFVRGLYRALSTHPRLRMATFAECCDNAADSPPPELPRVVSGSWVHGQLLTWIGHADKNRCWQLLIDAKKAYDRHAGELSPAAREHALRLLGICEGSDWFWWPGAFNPEAAVSDFDLMFRAHLQALYRGLGIDAPPELEQSLISSAAADPQAAKALGAMLPSR
ncbi:MAG: glycoside hydrolase family 57 protein [Nevskiales bacterium]|nr:glycoside hydrolase family 57 protein [Nevskiales bacterium]